MNPYALFRGAPYALFRGLAPYALKGQKLLAQGTPWVIVVVALRPVRAKALKI